MMQLSAFKEKVALRAIGLEIDSESESDSEYLDGDEETSECNWTSTSESESSDTEDGDISVNKSEQLQTCKGSPRCNDTSGVEHSSQQQNSCIHTNHDVAKKGCINCQIDVPDHYILQQMLRDSKLNWFVLVHKLQMCMKAHTSNVCMEQLLTDFAQKLPFMDIETGEARLIEQSRQTFLQSEKSALMEKTGLTDSESDDPEEWQEIKSLRSEEWRNMIRKQRGIVKRMAKRKASK